MADHDQRLKVTLTEFLGEFVGLRLPGWHSRFDFSTVEWLQQEVFANPPRGERREIDLVARVALRQPVGASAQALVHVEVESGDAVADLRGRMPRYHDFLGYRHGLPVLSLALYLGVGLEGIGWDGVGEDFWEESLGNTRWPYLGLPALDALSYVEGDNLLGMAFCALMRVPEERRVWLKARALRRIAEAELTAYRRFLLMDFIEAYLPLVGPHLEEYERLLLTEDFTMVRVLGKTTFEKGEEQGIVKGQRELLLHQLQRRFGPLSEAARQRLESWPVDGMRKLGEDLLTARSLVELGLEDAPNGSDPPAG